MMERPLVILPGGAALASALEAIANVLTAATDAAAALMPDKYPPLPVAGVAPAVCVRRGAGDGCRFINFGQEDTGAKCESYIRLNV